MLTNQDAIQNIAHAIEANGIDIASREEYDLDAILGETHKFDQTRGYVQTATEDEFWTAVTKFQLIAGSGF